jgi:hypothetical protein
VGVYLVPEGHYCARVNTVQSYGDVNREVSAAVGLLGLRESRTRHGGQAA